MCLKNIHVLFILISSVCLSQTKMPAFFSNNMVLQQQYNVPIWGTDEPGSIIEIRTSWGLEKTIKTEANGKWETSIATNEASFEKQEITVKGSSTITFQNVLIGEVWFCSGQSNMEMPMKGLKGSQINNGEELIKTSENTNIHLFNSEKRASLSLEDDVIGTWEKATPESVKNFSAVGYMFSRMLYKKLQVPIGIIEAAWGGTPIECWLPESYIQQHPEIKVPDVIDKDQNKQKRPTLLYNAMIHPFKNYAIKGFLWYQGEANRRSAKYYNGYMHTLINSWRDQWQHDNLPFYFVQIAPYDYNMRYKSKADSFGANLVREAQSLAAKEIPNTGVVITTDVGKCNQIHPPEKNTIAQRLANWALAEQYNFKDIAYRSPEYKSMEVKKDKAIISFDFYGKNKQNNMFDRKSDLKNFVIAGEDRIFYHAEVKINKNVRYGFEDCLEGTLFSDSGLPVSPFRTDDWDK